MVVLTELSIVGQIVINSFILAAPDAWSPAWNCSKAFFKRAIPSLRLKSEDVVSTSFPVTKSSIAFLKSSKEVWIELKSVGSVSMLLRRKEIAVSTRP